MLNIMYFTEDVLANWLLQAQYLIQEIVKLW